jgi:hypothetical protein
VANQVAIGQVDPDTWIIIAGRSRQNEKLIPGMHASEVPGTVTENGAVNRSTEAGRMRRRKWWREPGSHRNPNVTTARRRGTVF